MKIKKLEINKYLQFKDFKLDLTYPNGHEKAGQPMAPKVQKGLLLAHITTCAASKKARTITVVA